METEILNNEWRSQVDEAIKENRWRSGLRMLPVGESFSIENSRCESLKSTVYNFFHRATNLRFKIENHPTEFMHTIVTRQPDFNEAA